MPVPRFLGPTLIVPSIVTSLGRGQQRRTSAGLHGKFKNTQLFWRHFEIAKSLAAVRDARVLPELESWLSQEDRHLRGNAAFVFAALGEHRGFDVITAILDDYSDRPEGQGASGADGP